MSEIEAWIAAGLYDPDRPDGAERLALLEYVASLGVDLDTMVAYNARGTLGRAATDHVLRPRPTLTRDEAAAAAGLEPEQVDRAWLAVGLPTHPADELAYNDGDVELMRTFAAGSALFGFAGVLQFSRVLGTSLERIAEAAVASFLVNVEAPLVAGGGGALDRSRTSTESIELLLTVPDVFGPLFRRHVKAALERIRSSQDPGSFDTFRMAVGFLDLVGYTEWSATLPVDELSAAVSEFEAAASERITQAGARVVKNIGDAVMFVALETTTACRVALDLCAFVHAHPSLTELRAAVATGEVLARDGDYFGATVNRAARLVKAAEPGHVVSDAPPEGFAAQARPVQALRGIEGDVEVWQIS